MRIRLNVAEVMREKRDDRKKEVSWSAVSSVLSFRISRSCDYGKK